MYKHDGLLYYQAGHYGTEKACLRNTGAAGMAPANLNFFVKISFLLPFWPKTEFLATLNTQRQRNLTLFSVLPKKQKKCNG